jgi:hypothetical protein
VDTRSEHMMLMLNMSKSVPGMLKNLFRVLEKWQSFFGLFGINILLFLSIW